MTKIGVSGMGRIGRLFVRSILSGGEPELELAAINSVYPAATIAHLLKYDTMHGVWDADIEVEEEALCINGHRIAFIMERDPSRLPWQSLGVQIAIDATGKFTDRHGASQHLSAGASKVIVTAPAQDLDATIVMGVNNDTYNAEGHHLLSAASCTTNCVSPVLKILDDAFELKSGWITTVHAYTNDQQHLDNPHADLRRARACTQSIIPTKTGVGMALREVLPHLAPVIQGIALRVPVPDVSVIDVVAQLGCNVTTDEVKELFTQASQGAYAGYVAISNDPLVSSDYIGNNMSAVVDGLSVMTSGNQLKMLAWYDNEWGYACRVVDLAALVAAHLQQDHIRRTEGGEKHEAIGSR